MKPYYRCSDMTLSWTSPHQLLLKLAHISWSCTNSIIRGSKLPKPGILFVIYVNSQCSLANLQSDVFPYVATSNRTFTLYWDSETQISVLVQPETGTTGVRTLPQADAEMRAILETAFGYRFKIEERATVILFSSFSHLPTPARSDGSPASVEFRVILRQPDQR